MTANSIFHAEMTEDEVIKGEKLHQEIETQRRLVLVAGLTKSSDELKEAISRDTKTYLSAIEQALTVLEHNDTVRELTLLSLVRMFSVAQDTQSALRDERWQALSGQVSTCFDKHKTGEDEI